MSPPGTGWAVAEASPARQPELGRSSGTTGARIPLLRIGLFTEAKEIRISSSGSWYLGRHRSGLRPTRVASRAAWSLRAESGQVTVIDETGQRRGEGRDTLCAWPEDPEMHPLTLDGREFRGQMLLWHDGGKLVASNILDLESYLRGVLPLEMGPQPPERFEALKAQAVAARTYALANLGRWKVQGYDLVATVKDQVYGGVQSERPDCSQAVEETRGVVALHDGRPIQAFYGSTCGGHTATPEEVWERPPLPYLQGVKDRAEHASAAFCDISPRYHWSEEWEGAAFETMLDSTLPRTQRGWERKKYGRLVQVEIKERSSSTRVSRLILKFERGSVTLGGDEIRWVIRRPDGSGLRSCLLQEVKTERRGKRITKVRVSGRGYGHGVGLCQFGAMGMAAAGYDFTRIVRFYYRGADVSRLY